MAVIKIKRGTTTPTTLAEGEPALKKDSAQLYIATDTSNTIKWIGAEIENSPTWASASATKLATQSAINTQFMPKSGGTFTDVVSFGQGSTSSGEIRLLEDSDSGTNYIAIKAPTAVTSNITLTLPDGDGDAGQVLTTDGSGVLSWASVGAATTATNIAGGAAGSLPYQSAASTTTFLADPDLVGPILTYNNSTNAPEWKAGTGTGDPVRATSPSFTTSIATGSTTIGVFDSTATTVDAFGAATTLNLGHDGAATATTNINVAATNNKTVNIATGAGGNRTVNLATGGTAGVRTVGVLSLSSFNEDFSAVGQPVTANIDVGVNLDTNSGTVNIGTGATGTTNTMDINIGTSGKGTTTVNNNLVVSGNFTVNGTTTNINTTNLVVEDKNIIIADVATPTDITADGAGITVKGTSDKTLNWVDSTDAWTSSEHFNLASGKAYYINGTSVLNATTLGSAVVTSSLTTVGALSSGSIASGFTAINVADLINITSLNIDAGTETTTIVGSDLLIVDDGANGTNRKVTVDNLFGSSSTATIDGGTY